MQYKCWGIHFWPLFCKSSLKNDNFCPEWPVEMPSYIGLLVMNGFCKKSNVMFQSCVWAEELGNEITSHLDTRDALKAIWLKTAPNGQKRPFLCSFLCEASRVLEWDVMKCAVIVAQAQNYRFFQNSSDGPSDVALFICKRTESCQLWLGIVWWGPSSKKVWMQNSIYITYTVAIKNGLA